MRIALGLYLLVHFGQLLPYGAELFSNSGTLADPALSPLFDILPSPFWIHDGPAMATTVLALAMMASLAFCLGVYRRASAVLLAYLWAALFCRNPLIANPSLAYVSLMLVLSLLVPVQEVPRPGRSDPRKWYFPSGVYTAAWFLLAAGYTFSGLIKLQSPSWIDGTALIHLAENPLARPGWMRDALLSLPDAWLHGFTWLSLAGEILFLPLSFCRKGRLLVWTLMLGMHLGILLVVDFLDLTLAMVLIHLFVFDPDWLPPREDGKRRTLFYDGDCGLCTHSVRFFMEEDRAALISYAPLQGSTAAEQLPPELRQPDNLATVVFLEDTTRHIRSRAVIRALDAIGGPWRIAAWLLHLIPLPLREMGYRGIARNRLRIFPKGACALPTEQERSRLLP